MKKIPLQTVCKKMLADVYTPVGIYLRLRDRFRDTILLESTDFHAAENSYSFICINAIGGIEISAPGKMESKLPGQQPQKHTFNEQSGVAALIYSYLQHFDSAMPSEKPAVAAQGLFGYTTYDAIQFFESVHLASKDLEPVIPLMRYRMYQYVIAINHFRDELLLCENILPGLESEVNLVESLIRSKDVPVYPFHKKGEESSTMSDEDYRQMVREGIKHCHRGDVFQIVLSRRFEQSFTGDDFNVYRALRNINPSPYLFYFDYSDYKLMGSSPESQLIIKEGKAVVHPIAGTFKRTGDDEVDTRRAAELLEDAKENAEHVMLVDLARNDLSRKCTEVSVSHYRQVQYYSHVIHLVSEVVGKVVEGTNPMDLLATTFPAGTLSGAPKFKAMEIIDSLEPHPRSYYGGCIGIIGIDGSFNHAILIRSILSRHNTLVYQAGAGVVAASQPESELQEVNNKLNALRQAIGLAETLQ
jgi:anthranilate synthase component I